MKLKSLTFLLVAVILTAGCKQKTPDCNDEGVKKLAIEIIAKQPYIIRQIGKDRDFLIKNVIIKNHNKELDYYLCSANVHASYSDEKINQLIEEAAAKIEQEIENEISREITNINDSLQYANNDFENSKRAILKELEEQKKSANSSYQSSLDTILASEQHENNNFEARKREILEAQKKFPKVNYQDTLDAYERYYQKAMAENIERRKNREEWFNKEMKESEEKYNRKMTEAQQRFERENQKLEKELAELKAYDKASEIEKRLDNKYSYLSETRELQFPISYTVEATDGGEDYQVTVKF